MKLLKLYCLSWFLGLPFLAAAQQATPKEPIRLVQVKTFAGYYLPQADLTQRFGGSALVGMEVSYQLKSGWLFGVSGGHLFGNNVLERDIMSNITTASGDIITANGVYEDYRLRTFGWVMNARVGKIIPVIGPNVNSGLLVDFGLGIMQHKIWIETPVINSPQLEGDYKKGYDRLTNGLSLNQFIGYQHLSNNRLINFYVGVDVHEGFTQNRRSVNYNTGLKDDRQRLDVLIGLKAGWILPLYHRAEKELSFY